MDAVNFRDGPNNPDLGMTMSVSKEKPAVIGDGRLVLRNSAAAAG